MRSIIKKSIVFLLLVLSLLVVGCSLPQIEIPGNSSKGDGPFSVKVFSHVQNAETGDYEETLVETFTVEKGGSYTATPNPPQYHVYNPESSTASATNVRKDTTLRLYYDCETCTVTFASGGGELVSGKETVVIRKGQTPTPPEYARAGYSFTGYDYALRPIYQDTHFTACWEVKKLYLTLSVPVGAVIVDSAYVKSTTTGGWEYRREITVESTFALPTPYYDGGTFRGWKYTLSDENTVTAVSRGTTQSITLYADFGANVYEMVFCGDGIPQFDPYVLPAGSVVFAPQIPPESQRIGYGINWYKNADCTVLYDFTTMPSGGVTVYGKWQKDAGTGFIGWDVETEEIDSFEELKTFIEYVVFYNVTTPVTVSCNFATYSTIENYIQEAYNQLSFRQGGVITYSVEDRWYGLKISVAATDSSRQTDASKTTPKNQTEVYDYVGYEVQGRSSTFDDFYIDSIPDAVTVETSNQLSYVVERGARPVCVAGSKAETVYLAARNVLRRIISDSYTDYEKVEAIYDYLVLNVQYDSAQIESQLPYDWTYYDAYYLEGVFLNQKAVCDGISKAFTLMCRIEGIPCVQVIGAKYHNGMLVSGSGHAWCKVKINNRWYVVDPTFGNLQISDRNKSVMDHEMFLTDDNSKTDDGYVADNFTEIVCNTNYGYFDRKEVSVGGVTIDFVIDTVQELSYMLEYCIREEENLRGFSIDFVYQITDPQYRNNFIIAYNSAVNALRGRGKTYNYSMVHVGNGYGEVVKLIFS